MKKGKIITFLVSVLCAFALLIGVFGSISPLSVYAAEGRENKVTATANTTVKQGSSGYCYVYIDSLKSLSSLTVAVHFDPNKISVTNSFNLVSCSLYDSSVGESGVQYSYIFDGNGEDVKTPLFYFQYKVLADAEVGGTYFDIVVSDAYDAQLQVMTVEGSRHTFTIEEKGIGSVCNISSSSTVSSSVNEEFTLDYSLSTYQIASGAFSIEYDPNLFEVVEVIKGDFLSDKITDVNTKDSGSITVSFVGTTYNSSQELISVKFKTLKNASEISAIKLKVTELYDLNLNGYSSDGFQTDVNISYVDDVPDERPGMVLVSEYDKESGKLTLSVVLESDSNLGAGDFVINFDPEILVYESYQKRFIPTFFSVNTKNTDNGELKFAIISMSDIVKKTYVMNVTFDVKPLQKDVVTRFEISGSGLTDSLTNPITLKFVGTSVIIPAKPHNYGDWSQTTAPGCTQMGEERRYCNDCGVYEAREVEPLGHSLIETAAKTPSCTESGWNAYKSCTRCEYSTFYELDAIGHNFEYSYTVNKYVCENCGKSNALGDVNSDGYITNADVLLMVRYMYDGVLYPIPVFDFADVNGDGSITNDDVWEIFRYIYNPMIYPIGKELN